MSEGSAVVSLRDAPWTTGESGSQHASLTDALGATETQLAAYRLDRNAAVTLPDDRERLVLPLRGTIDLGEPFEEVGEQSVVLLPAGRSSTIRCTRPAELLVISAPAPKEGSTAPTVIDLETAEYTVPETSDIATAFLTGPLGARGMKVNARRLEPGQVVPYHTEGDQEELFVPLEGPAALRIDDERYPLGVGSVGRVAPPVPRSAVNDGDESALWVMVGAPPTGADDWWDPGAEILE